MEFITNVGKKVGSNVGQIFTQVDAPNYMTWFVVPLIITFVIASYIGYRLVRNWDTITSCKAVNVDVKVNEEQDDSLDEEQDDSDDGLDENGCRIVEFKPVYRVLVVLVVGTLVAASAASFAYRTGVYIKNPKIGLGIEAGRILNEFF